MVDKIKLKKISPTVIAQFWQSVASVEIIEILKKCPHKGLPGFVLAEALIEAYAANQRNVVVGAMYRDIAREGHDLSKVKDVMTSYKGKEVMIELIMFDLCDLVEGEP